MVVMGGVHLMKRNTKQMQQYMVQQNEFPVNGQSVNQSLFDSKFNQSVWTNSTSTWIINF